MAWQNRFAVRRLEQVAVVVVMASVALIHFFADHKLVALNFFYIPVLAVAFFFGRRLGALTVLLCFLLVLASAMLAPQAYNLQVTKQMLAIDLAVWGAFLALAVLLVGGLTEWRRHQLLGADSEKTAPASFGRRRDLRIQAALPAKYWYLNEAGDVLESGPWDGTVANISKGGVQLLAQVPPEDLVIKVVERRLPVYLEVDLPDRDGPIEVVTRPAWVQPRTVKPPQYRMGLEFREITQSDRDRIIHYIISDRIQGREDTHVAAGGGAVASGRAETKT